MQFCLEMLEFPCVGATSIALLSRLCVPRSSPGANTQQGCLCVCLYTFLLNQQPFIQGISEETLAGKAAHTDSGLRISERVT